MNNDAKKYRVSIGGNSYALVTDEPEEVLKEAALLVDSLVGHSLASTASDHHRVVMLAALKIAVDLIHIKTVHQRQQARLDLLVERLDSFITVLQ